jgi:hypothetical protein
MSIRNVISDIRQAGLSGGVRITGGGYRIEVKTERDKQGCWRCIGALLPSDENQHKQFAQMMIQEARTKILRMRAGQDPEVGTQEKVSVDDIKLVERAN